MNKYINLNRLEFIVTHKCSSKCKHCSNVSDDNETRRLLKEISYSGINIGSGNVMFANGSAVHNFSDKFKKVSSFKEMY
jgi:hypothetical protein